VVTRSLKHAVFLVALLLVPFVAAAGTISFQVSLTGQALTVTNRGDSPAFFPSVYKMMPDGRWEILAVANPPAELGSGGRMQLGWPGDDAPRRSIGLERQQPMMVHFFDQTGVAFGQIFFLQAPPPAAQTLRARYDGSDIVIEPPVGTSLIRTSWVLWSREDGIAALRFPLRLDHAPPQAMRIDWPQRGSLAVRVSTGAGQPEVFLIHETAQGIGLQTVHGGGLQGREQRAAWLDAASFFYLFALGAVVAALAAIMLYLNQVLRRKSRV
jgi:hypothetical protein